MALSEEHHHSERASVFLNYIWPHEALDEKKPADVCGIKIEGGNKWITILQNASKLNQRRA